MTTTPTPAEETTCNPADIYLAALLDTRTRFSLVKQLVNRTTYYRPMLSLRAPTAILKPYCTSYGGKLKADILVLTGRSCYKPLVAALPFMQHQQPAATILLEAAEWFLLPRSRRYVKIGVDTKTCTRHGKSYQKRSAIREIAGPFETAMENLREQLALLQ